MNIKTTHYEIQSGELNADIYADSIEEAMIQIKQNFSGRLGELLRFRPRPKGQWLYWDPKEAFK
jgi:hypothetical protein